MFRYGKVTLIIGTLCAKLGDRRLQNGGTNAILAVRNVSNSPQVHSKLMLDCLAGSQVFLKSSLASLCAAAFEMKK